jgi:Zn-dependent protease with chaperone function
MDFFERQDHARRSTKLLVAYFIAGVALITLAVYLAALGVFGLTRHHNFLAQSAPLAFWNPKLFFQVAVLTLAVIGIGSVSKTLELNRGGSVVATTLGGRLIDPASSNADERKLLNVVEEMAIASGVPVPQVYLLPMEQGINAFAAGHTPSDAVVAVTSGAMKRLSRDELQGVIAHEFSHILNGDMRLNIRLMGAIFGILCVAIIGRILLQVRSRGGRDRNPLPLLGLALVVIGSAGVFFGRLIQSAVSRQREFLADASAVQFTRNPGGLASALKKIGGLSLGSRLENSHADAASHMFFSNGMRSSFLHFFDTHPPLAERIRALDPSFDGVFPDSDTLAPQGLDSMGDSASIVGSLRAPAIFPAPMAALTGLPTITPGSISSLAGTPATRHLRYAEELCSGLPPSLQEAARESMGATALVYGLLLSDDTDARNKQLSELAQASSPGVCQETLRILPDIKSVSARAKLPLIDLALPGLRHLSPLQLQEFQRAVKVLVESDGEIDLFEFMLQKIVTRHLASQYTDARKPVIQFYALKPLLPDCAVLLSELAYVGQQDPGKAAVAFQKGAVVLANMAKAQISMVPQSQCDLEQVDAALNRLNLAAPQIKKNVLEACAQTVACDGVIEEMEAELLRAIADGLDCPLPPLIGDLIPQAV